MIEITRHPSADALLAVARPLLLRAEAENHLIIGVAEGLARTPQAAVDPYLATASESAQVLACAVHIAPFKVLLTRANREVVAALAADAFAAVPGITGVIGPEQSADDFATAWSRLSGAAPRINMRMRIHETRKVARTGVPPPPGTFRGAASGDIPLLTAWTEVFVGEAGIQEKFDPGAIVTDGVKRGRVFVWDDAGLKSMAQWTGRTPNGVRLNCVYTPREFRGHGYATACVRALTQQQLDQGREFCWLYTDLSSAASPNIFKRIGYSPVSDVAEYYLNAE